jgi:hypothetical protein
LEDQKPKWQCSSSPFAKGGIKGGFIESRLYFLDGITKNEGKIINRNKFKYIT